MGSKTPAELSPPQYKVRQGKPEASMVKAPAPDAGLRVVHPGQQNLFANRPHEVFRKEQPVMRASGPHGFQPGVLGFEPTRRV
jgi:hypothetical protein